MILYLYILYFAILKGTDPPVFEQQTIDDNVKIGYGLAVGDVDGDGKPDILLADKNEFVWYRNGDWERFVMAENLTASDNVCIAARDIDGDGKVEVAVGAQWNPGEVSDPEKSGSVHYLIRPDDPTQKWEAVQLHHEPTVHRMRWVEADKGKFHLIVLPLHGRDNVNGAGAGVKVIAYEMPEENPKQEWKYFTIDESMHLTHNLDVVREVNGEKIYIGGKEGVKSLSYLDGEWQPSASGEWLVRNRGFGEIRSGNARGREFLAGIEPMHGNLLTVYNFSAGSKIAERNILASDFHQGHALGVADLLGLGSDQVVAGWRNPNQDQKVGIKLFVPENKDHTEWEEFWIDENGMACEDLLIADLNGDGKPDIIASGRATNNLKIYWNKNGQ